MTHIYERSLEKKFEESLIWDRQYNKQYNKRHQKTAVVHMTMHKKQAS